jgi:hypothetical protein
MILKTKMRHVCYLDHKAKELDLILSGKKKMLIRGAMGRKLPYGRVFEGDELFFINNNGEGKIKSKCRVKKVLNSDKMDEKESLDLIEIHQKKLKLTDDQLRRWAGKRYLVLIEIDSVQSIRELVFDKSRYSTMNDWVILSD